MKAVDIAAVVIAVFARSILMWRLGLRGSLRQKESRPRGRRRRRKASREKEGSEREGVEERKRRAGAERASLEYWALQLPAQCKQLVVIFYVKV